MRNGRMKIFTPRLRYPDLGLRFQIRPFQAEGDHPISSHLLFEVAPFLFINQHQVQVIAHRKLLVDVSHRGGQVVASQKQPDGNGLAWDENML